MVFGLTAFSGCVAYLAYLNANAENQADLEAYRSETGHLEYRPVKPKSRWDWWHVEPASVLPPHPPNWAADLEQNLVPGEQTAVQ